jgi:hypothetical protein
MMLTSDVVRVQIISLGLFEGQGSRRSSRAAGGWTRIIERKSRRDET